MGPFRWRTVILFTLLAAAAAGVVWWNYVNQPDYLLRQGQEALAEGDVERASTFAELLNQRGHEPWAHLLAGEIKLKRAMALVQRAQATPARRIGAQLEAEARGDLEMALVEFTRVKDDGPLAQSAAAFAGECLYRLGHFPLAAKVLSAVVEQQPDHLNAHRWLVAIYTDLNDPIGTIQHLREWARLDPENGRPYRWLGFNYRHFFGAQYHEAITAYRDALARRLDPPMRAEVVRELAETLIRNSGRYREALEVLDQCPPDFRSEPVILTLRAEALRGLGRSSEAVALTDEVLKTKGNYVPALRLRASFHLLADEPEQARRLLEKAIQISPHDLPLREQLLAACTQMGDTQEAAKQQKLVAESRRRADQITELIRRARAVPWDDDARLRLGLLLIDHGRPEDARVWLRAALTSNPRNQRAREILQRISTPGDTKN